nr:DUF4113 domain-containing protein [Herbaspirillum robiniae]
MDALDAVNKRYGRNTLRLASGLGPHRWKARFDMLSPLYTTDWGQLC